MANNIEIKAHVWDLAALRRRAEALSDTPCQEIPQEDTFFYTPQGRLKLRQLAPDHAQLIYYLRENSRGPKNSEYHIYETDQPEQLKSILGAAYGLRGVVRKVRYLYLVGQTRLHLDEVEELGQFVELEVVLRSDQSSAQGEAIAKDLMDQLGIRTEDLIDVAYIDLLEKTGS